MSIVYMNMICLSSHTPLPIVILILRLLSMYDLGGHYVMMCVFRHVIYDVLCFVLYHVTYGVAVFWKSSFWNFSLSPYFTHT